MCFVCNLGTCLSRFPGRDCRWRARQWLHNFLPTTGGAADHSSIVGIVIASLSAQAPPPSSSRLFLHHYRGHCRLRRHGECVRLQLVSCPSRLHALRDTHLPHDLVPPALSPVANHVIARLVNLSRIYIAPPSPPISPPTQRQTILGPFSLPSSQPV